MTEYSDKFNVPIAYSSEKREIYHPYLCKKSEDGNIKYISIPNNINMDYILKFKAIELIKEGKIKIRLEDKI